jgi:hypothetical protein
MLEVETDLGHRRAVLQIVSATRNTSRRAAHTGSGKGFCSEVPGDDEVEDVQSPGLVDRARECRLDLGAGGIGLGLSCQFSLGRPERLPHID